MENNMAGRICMVTGANSGIGYETALGLAKMGATVIMVCRNEKKGTEAMEQIKKETGNNAVSLMLADLSSQASIRKLATEFTEKYNKLHVLVNNAGGVFGKRLLTIDNIEWTFAVNYLCPFLLTNLLLPVLKANAPSRVINVASEAQAIGHIDFDDIQGEKKYGSWRAYGQAKLADIIFTYELARRLTGTKVTANCLHPGVVSTNFGNSLSGFFRFLLKLARPFLITSKKGAKTSVYLASSPDVENISGKYFKKCREEKSIKESYDEDTAKKLWEISAKLTKL